MELHHMNDALSRVLLYALYYTFGMFCVFRS